MAELDFLIPFRKRYDPILGVENAESLLKACWGWIDSQHYLRREGLKQIIADTNFQKILEVHKMMKEHGSPNLVEDYILELSLSTGYQLLMVPYVYISGTVPRRFLRARIGFLGFGSGLPETMKQLGLLESCSSEKMVQVGLFEACRSNVQFICRYCKRFSEMYALSSRQGPFHEVSCPRYLPAEQNGHICSGDQSHTKHPGTSCDV
jgi:hypothetical protein